MIKYVSYHNRNPIYLDCGKQLKNSLDKVGITNYHIEIINNDTWNCYEAWAYKPVFIYDCLKKFCKHDRLVYLDSDSIVMEYPGLFDYIPEKFDIGVHYKDGKELLGATIYLRNNKKVKSLVADWAMACHQHKKVWDQKVLQEMIDHRPGIELYCLPATYCQIFDLMANEGGPPVIKQMQASRLSRGFNLDHNPIVEAA